MSENKANLASAYSAKRKPKKMAKGGKVESDLDHGSKKGPEGYSKYQEQAQNQKGIHTPVSGVTGYPGGKGTSEAGDMSTQTYADKPNRGLRDHGKELHRKKLEEMKKMPKPKLQGLARGGMVESNIIKPRPLDSLGRVSQKASENDELEHPAGLEEDSDEMQMPVDEYMANHFAKGGPVDEKMTSRPDKGWGAIIVKDKQYAHGGEVSPEDEIMEDHYDSIAAAIMAKKARKMAEGGMVDIDSNAEEQPNSYYSANEAALKENYDSDMDDVSQPTDSNEHGHTLSDEDAYDLVQKIRAKMNMKRQFGNK